MFLFLLSQTDGASACLIMSEEKALALGLRPKAYLRYVLPCFIMSTHFNFLEVLL